MSSSKAPKAPRTQGPAPAGANSAAPDGSKAAILYTADSIRRRFSRDWKAALQGLADGNAPKELNDAMNLSVEEVAKALFDEYYEQLAADPGYKPTKEQRQMLRNLALSVALIAVIPGLQQGTFQWNNHEELMGALGNLRTVGADVEMKDKSLLFVYMAVCFALEQYADAEDASTRLRVVDPSGDDAPMLRSIRHQIDRQLAFPLFRKDFADRCRKAWSIFAGGFGRLETLQEDTELEGPEDGLKVLCYAFSSHLDFAVTPVLRQQPQTASVSPAPTVSLHFIPDDLDLDLFPMEYAISLMPASLREDCLAVLGVPAEAQAKNQYPEGEDPNTIRILVSDSPEHKGADVLLYDPFVEDELSPESPIAQLIADSWVRLTLGDFQAKAQVRSVSVSASILPARGSHPLPELPRLLQKLGYPEKVSPQDYIRSLHRTYTRKATPAGWHLRNDITSGWTDCMELQEDYEQEDSDTFRYYLNMGVAAVFVAWPNSRRTDSKTDLLPLLKDHLADISIPPGYRIIGEAAGTRYNYLDLLIWTQEPVLRALESFFQGLTNGHLARIQAFCHDAPSFPIRLDSLSEDAPQPETGFVPSTRQSGASGSQKKGKKGKGKRGKK